MEMKFVRSQLITVTLESVEELYGLKPAAVIFWDPASNRGEANLSFKEGEMRYETMKANDGESLSAFEARVIARLSLEEEPFEESEKPMASA